MDRGLICVCREEQHRPLGACAERQHLRQRRVAAGHPDAVEIDARQRGAEVSATGDDTIHHVPQSRMKFVGVSEVSDEKGRNCMLSGDRDAEDAA
jgi:hypothetical protein